MMNRPAFAQKGRFWWWIASLPIAISLASSMAMANLLPEGTYGALAPAKVPSLPVFVDMSLAGQSPTGWPAPVGRWGTARDHSVESGAREQEAEPALELAVHSEAGLSTAERWTYFVGALPQSPREAGRAVRTVSGDVLGSIPLAVSLVPQSRRWRSLLEERAVLYFADSCSASEPICASKLLGRLAEAVAIARTQGDRDAIDTVNKAVNSGLKYKRDLDSYGVQDYWATVDETLTRGTGDCEEFAILKMWMLLAAGFDRSQIRLQLVKLLKTGEDHAILVVDAGATRLVLDNLSASVRNDGEVSEYLPMLSFVGEDAFLHGFKSRPAKSNEIAALR